ncbi:MAG TPA: sigma 54-interacting transcriptional regulator [Anaeromyxobacteraceae bacterium]|nr:sigma 54-interacting transcriptional regulator [Anaeromyxobacteraceae bacterium]
MHRPASLASARAARAQPATRYDFECILGDSGAIREVIERARTAAHNDLPVVLCGESGTGKELFAQAIHSASDRRQGPFVAVNCGSIPESLTEAHLFGYEPGAFTGANRCGSPGSFEDANGGTLLLDEVTELSPQAQTALLRVLQEREVVRVGGSAPRRVDIRIMAATNRLLTSEIQAKRFRLDLYYRLNVLPISLPPLREREEDVSLLARSFLAEATETLGRVDLALTADALGALRAHRWPGNVRELRNVILRAAAMAPLPHVAAKDLSFDPQPWAPEQKGPWVLPQPPEGASTEGANSLCEALVNLVEVTGIEDEPALATALAALLGCGEPVSEHALNAIVRDVKTVILKAAQTYAGGPARDAELSTPNRTLAIVAAESAPELTGSAPFGLRETRFRAERARILEALESCSWNLVRTAQRLGVSRSTLYRILDRYNLRRSTHSE